MPTAPAVPLWALLAISHARTAAYLEDTGKVERLPPPEVKPLTPKPAPTVEYPEDFDFLSLLADD